MDLGDEVDDSDRLVAVRAWSPRSEPSGENAALVATLLSEQPCFTFGALVHDAGSRQTPSQAEWKFVRWLLAPTKATLTAGICAVRLTATWDEASTTRGSTLAF